MLETSVYLPHLQEIPAAGLGEKALRYIMEQSIEIQRIRHRFDRTPDLEVAYEPLVRGSRISSFLKAVDAFKRWRVNRRHLVVGIRFSTGCGRHVVQDPLG